MYILIYIYMYVYAVAATFVEDSNPLLAQPNDQKMGVFLPRNVKRTFRLWSRSLQTNKDIKRFIRFEKTGLATPWGKHV